MEEHNPEAASLVVDQGNTCTKTAVFAADGHLIEAASCRNPIGPNDPDNPAQLAARHHPKRALISSVIGKEAALYRLLENHVQGEICCFDADTPVPLKTCYQPPESLGRDRLAAAVGAARLYPRRDILVADVGTALTFELINADGTHFGGNISPGMAIRLRALNAFTGKLPLIDAGADPAVFHTCIAQRTADAIRVGVVSGIAYEIEGYIRQMLVWYPNAVFFLTGGDAPTFHTCLTNRFPTLSLILDPHLALKGLNHILAQLTPLQTGMQRRRRLVPAYRIPRLPLSPDIEAQITTQEVIRKTVAARTALATMRSTVVTSLPNAALLLFSHLSHPLPSSDSSANSSSSDANAPTPDLSPSDSKKEADIYADALLSGFDAVMEDNRLTLNRILQIQSDLGVSRKGFRRESGAKPKKLRSGEIIYTPPRTYDEIVSHMENLERFINDDSLSACDPLVKMAVIHHRFADIQPFYEANETMGTIIDLLYLVKAGLMDTPVLPLHRYLNQHIDRYEELLQQVREYNSWEEWILFMLDGVEHAARQTTVMTQQAKQIMLAHKEKIRADLPGIYSMDLLTNIFRHPYTRIDLVMHDLSVTRNTALRYLEELTRIGILRKEKIGRTNHYINTDFITLFENPPCLTNF